MSEAEYDLALAIALDEILPSNGDRGNWQRVLADANRHRWRPSGHGRRLAIAATLVAIGALIPLTAVAAGNDWWFFSDSTSSATPPPAGPVVVVRSGSWQGVPWALTAFRTTSEGLCIAFTPNPPTGISSGSSGVSLEALNGSARIMGCGEDVRGTENLAKPQRSVHEVGFFTLASSPGEGKPFDVIAGSAAADVTSVQISRSDGSSIVAQTFPAPSQLGVAVRFFVAELPLGGTVRSVVALGASGNTLETITAPQAPAPPVQGTTIPTNSYTYTSSWGS